MHDVGLGFEATISLYRWKKIHISNITAQCGPVVNVRILSIEGYDIICKSSSPYVELPTWKSSLLAHKLFFCGDSMHKSSDFTMGEFPVPGARYHHIQIADDPYHKFPSFDTKTMSHVDSSERTLKYHKSGLKSILIFFLKVKHLGAAI